MAKKFTVTKDEQALIESIRKNGAIIDRKSGTVYMGETESLFTHAEVRAMFKEVLAYTHENNFGLSCVHTRVIDAVMKKNRL